jgi:type II secretory pathway pseudopilin PulG
MKRGISLVVVVVAITVMLIVISSASVIGFNAINTANFDEYQSVLDRVSSAVNQYYLENSSLPINNMVVAKESCDNSFLSAVSDNGDLENNLFVINMDKLNISTIEQGRGTVASGDVFLVSQNTNNIYYLKGYKYKSAMYYSLK